MVSHRTQFPRIVVKYVSTEDNNTTPIALPEMRTAYVNSPGADIPAPTSRRRHPGADTPAPTHGADTPAPTHRRQHISANTSASTQEQLLNRFAYIAQENVLFKEQEEDYWQRWL